MRVVIIGVGNCANSLLQGVEYYKDASPEDSAPASYMSTRRVPHHRHRATAAFDVVKGKVGVDLADAIRRAERHDQVRRRAEDRDQVIARHDDDGIGKYMAQVVEKVPGQTDDVVGILKETGTDVVVNDLPVRLRDGDEVVRRADPRGRVATVNCMPVFIARETDWQSDSRSRGLPIIGDDMSRRWARRSPTRPDDALRRPRRAPRPDDAAERGRQLRPPQHARARASGVEEDLEDNAVTSMLDDEIAPTTSTSARRTTCRGSPTAVAYIRTEGSSFGDCRWTWSSSSRCGTRRTRAGIVIDAVRLVKLALKNGISATRGSERATS